MKNFWKSIKITLAFCVLLSVCYVLVLWIFAKAVTPEGGNVQVVRVGGQIVGGANVGQPFSREIYFWGRPSAVNYDGSSSGGSNKAATNPEYLAEVESRIDTFLTVHSYLDRSEVTAEMVTASGSGLDPDISPASAYIQIKRVADARGTTPENIRELVDSQTEKPFLWLFGPEKVNVLKLNVSLDKHFPVKNTAQ